MLASTWACVTAAGEGRRSAEVEAGSDGTKVSAKTGSREHGNKRILRWGARARWRSLTITTLIHNDGGGGARQQMSATAEDGVGSLPSWASRRK